MAAKKQNDSSSVFAGNELIELKSADGQKWYSYLPHAGNILVSWKNKNACCILLSVNWRHSRQTAELAWALTGGSSRSGATCVSWGLKWIHHGWLWTYPSPRASFFVFYPWTSEPQLRWYHHQQLPSCLWPARLNACQYCSICNIEPSITKL